MARNDATQSVRARAAWALLALSILGCGERAPAGSEHRASTCPTATLDVPRSRGFPSAAAVETHARVLVQHDVDPSACLVSVVVRQQSSLLELTYAGTTYRARLASSLGTLGEGISEHVVAQHLLRRLLDANVTTAISSGRGVALGLADHTAVCLRSMSAAPSCVRTPAVSAFESVTQPEARQLVVDTISDASASEWALAFGDTATFSTRSGPLAPARALGAPPPDPDRFVDVRAASPEESSVEPDADAAAIAAEMPTGAATVRLETHTVAQTRVAVLQRCDGLIPHCVTVTATQREGAWLYAPSFADDPAHVDAVDDADALATGAVVVRLREASARDVSARDVFLVRAGDRDDLYDVTLGNETERGEGETATEGCYRSLVIEGANRVRLTDAQGWSGSHTARGWNVEPRATCAADATLCFDAASGFGPCG